MPQGEGSRRPGHLASVRFAGDGERISNRFSYLVLAATALLSFFVQHLLQSMGVEWAKWIGIAVAVLGALIVFAVLRGTPWAKRKVRGQVRLRPLALGGIWLIALGLTSFILWVLSLSYPQLNVVQLSYPLSGVIIGGIYAWVGLAKGLHKELFLGLWLIGVGLIGAVFEMPNMLLVIGGLSALGFLVAAWPSPSADTGTPVTGD